MHLQRKLEFFFFFLIKTSGLWGDGIVSEIFSTSMKSFCISIIHVKSQAQ